MTSYAGTIRVHVTGSSDREQVPDVSIDDMNEASWQVSTIRGAVPVPEGDEGAEVLVELMEGDRAGWTARATARLDGDEVRIEGTEAFMPGA